MRSTKPLITFRKNPGGSSSYCVDIGKVSGKRQRKFFATKAEASTFAEQAKIAKLNLGAAAFSITDKLRIEAVEANRRLGAVGASITEAVNFFLLHARPSGGALAVGQAVENFLESKKQAGLRPTYLKTIGYVLGKFCKEFGDKMVHQLGHVEIQKWLRGLDRLSLRSQGHYQADLRNFFGYAVRQGLTSINPIEKMEVPRPELKAVGILTVEQAIALLYVTREKDLPMLAYVTLGLFAGIRREEIRRLAWEEIKLAEKHVEITAAASKTRHRRIVTLSDNAVEWLQIVSQAKGLVAPHDTPYRLEKLVKLANIETFPRNALRHSFASYLIASTQNAALVAEQLGHTNLQTLYRNYREMVRPKEAEQFWQIKPESHANVIQLPVAV